MIYEGKRKKNVTVDPGLPQYLPLKCSEGEVAEAALNANTQVKYKYYKFILKYLSKCRLLCYIPPLVYSKHG